MVTCSSPVSNAMELAYLVFRYCSWFNLDYVIARYFISLLAFVFGYLYAIRGLRTESLWVTYFIAYLFMVFVSIAIITLYILLPVVIKHVPVVPVDPVSILLPILVVIISSLIIVAFKAMKAIEVGYEEPVGDEPIHVHLTGDDTWELPPDQRRLLEEQGRR